MVLVEYTSNSGWLVLCHEQETIGLGLLLDVDDDRAAVAHVRPGEAHREGPGDAFEHARP